MRTRLIEPVPGRPALIRPGELLTSAPAAVARWALAAEPLPGPLSEAGRVHRVRLAPGADVVDLTATLRGRGHAASPNHVLSGQPLFFGGPGGPPSPAPPPPYEPGEPCEVTVAVLDTGLAPHPWLARWYRDDIAETPDADGDGVLDRQAGHGTFVAGLILRQAPGARLRALRLLDSDGIGDEAALLGALSLLRGGPADVLNLSFGGHTFDDGPPLGLAEALAVFPAVVACAGNTASARPFWPAALPGVLAVGALDGDARAPFSAYGPWVDVWAPGVGLVSSFLEHRDFHGYASWSGTSFAAAVVSGVVARLCRKVPPDQAVRRLLRDGRRAGDLGVVVTTVDR
ncbi:peptidase S8 and S53 subtilisin kexin sedolisin [Microbispora triticiradicis]|uniref:Peptidase S8 and S53 subtilisin kexin sedolisin n=1 Tax=Microbispora triticiradicis TaxID=2200763 RepID=A0ABX9L9H9_9ACTN|nr:S8 family serine peptidase [Microbispora triticiradicis]RGA00393.1 peptidase S8 and S53 subtilisin kexin sedolisin [Microbispora triticiradicis]